MRNILVTGASGCIGRHVVPLLAARGWQVHAVSRREMLDAEGVTVHRADLLDAGDRSHLIEAVKPSHLLHLAWYIAPGRWAASPENYRWVEASLELVRLFRDSGGVRVVTAGSCLEYDWQYGYCSEERTPLTPHTFYGTCKSALGALLKGYAGASGFSNAWARIFFLYGPYEHPDRLIASVIPPCSPANPRVVHTGGRFATTSTPGTWEMPSSTSWRASCRVLSTSPPAARSR